MYLYLSTTAIILPHMQKTGSTALNPTYTFTIYTTTWSRNNGSGREAQKIIGLAGSGKPGIYLRFEYMPGIDF